MGGNWVFPNSKSLRNSTFIKIKYLGNNTTYKFVKLTPITWRPDDIFCLVLKFKKTIFVLQ